MFRFFLDLVRKEATKRTSFAPVLKAEEGGLHQRDLFNPGIGLFTAADREAGAQAAMDVHERQRLAALKAWETRRRNQAGGKQIAARDAKLRQERAAQAPKGLTPSLLRRDEETARIASEVVPKLSYSQFQFVGGGVNNSGIIKLPDGRQMFAKTSTHEENTAEVGAWNVAKAIGWGDLQMPTYMTKINKEEGIIRDLMPDGKVWERVDTATQQKVLGDKARMDRLALFEYIVGDHDDRHWRNYWVTKEGQLWPIDLARGFGDSVNRHSFRKVYDPELFLDKMPVEHLATVIEARRGIIDAADKVVNFNSHSRGSKGVRKRLAVLETAYNDAVAKKQSHVDLNPYIDEQVKIENPYWRPRRERR